MGWAMIIDSEVDENRKCWGWLKMDGEMVMKNVLNFFSVMGIPQKTVHSFETHLPPKSKDLSSLWIMFGHWLL